MKKMYIYYHVYLTDQCGTWYYLFLDQIYEIINHRLYDAVEKIKIVVIGNDTQLELFRGICSLYEKIEIVKELRTDNKDHTFAYASSIKYDGTTNVMDETQTLMELQNHAHREDAIFFYIHTKAITSPYRMEQEKIYVPFVNNYLWRKFLEFCVIENWKLCVSKLETHSVSGGNLAMWPIPHYSGTFWVSKSEYLRKLPDITKNDWWEEAIRNSDLKNFDSYRLKPEMFISMAYNNDFFNVLTAPNPPPISNLTWTHFPRFMYENAI